VRRPLLAVASVLLLQLLLLQVAQAGPHLSTARPGTAATPSQDPGRHLGWCDPQPPHGKDDKGHRFCHPSTTETTPTTGTTTPTTGTTTPTTGTTTPTTGTTQPPPPPVPGRGKFTREPASGPVGTVIKLASVTPSPLGGDQVAVVALVKADPDPIAVVSIAVDRSGAWQGNIVVPSNAEVGEYRLVAATHRVGGGGEFVYDSLPFFVVPSAGLPSPPPPPPPPPAVEAPSLTG
jgi:hypothetical protein